MAAPEGSVLRQVLDASLELATECEGGRVEAADLSWAVQLQRALEASGVQFNPHQRTPLSPTTTEGAVLECHLRRVVAAVDEAGATRLRLYFRVVRPDCPRGMGCLHMQ